MKHRGFQLVLLAASMAAAGYVRTVTSPLQESMALDLALSDNQMAILQGSAIGIPVALTAIPLGILIDRMSRVRLLAVLIAFSMIGSVLTAVAASFSVLAIARAIAGVTALAILPVVFSLIADLYEPAQRGRATTTAVIGQVAGNSLAFALGGALLVMAGPAPTGWRSAMLWSVSPLAIVLLLTICLREPPRTERAVRNPTLQQVWHELRHYRATFFSLAAGVILVETAVGAMLIWSAPMLSRLFDLRADDVGEIMAFGMLLSGILGPIIGGTLADICQRGGGPRRTANTLFGLALLSIPTTLFGIVPGVAPTSVLLVMSMTLMLAVAVMGMTLLTIVLPNELRGLCISALMAGIMLFGLAVAPLAVSVLSGAIGGAPMIGVALSIVCAGAGVLAAVTFALGRRHLSRSVACSNNAEAASVPAA